MPSTYAPCAMSAVSVILQASLLHAESLSGDNQYRCDFCAAKVDALRRVRLRSLPPYLCLALQRFYFNPNVSSSSSSPGSTPHPR